MNKYLQYYSRQQQITYLELSTAIEIILLRLSDSQNQESDRQNMSL